VAYLSTPYDSSFRAFYRFHRNTVQGHLGGEYAWINSAGRFSVDIEEDVGVIIKTGYGTRQRVPKLLAALADEAFIADTVIVQDYPPEFEAGYAWPDGNAVPTIDAIGWMVGNDLLKEQEHSERLAKYHSLVEVIQTQDWAHAEDLARIVGWELDAMKVIYRSISRLIAIVKNKPFRGFATFFPNHLCSFTVSSLYQHYSISGKLCRIRSGISSSTTTPMSSATH